MKLPPFYYILRNLKPEKILLKELGPKLSGANFMNLYHINKDIDEEEQVITLLHEMIHNCPEYIGKATISNDNIKIHEEIEKMALMIYNFKPAICEYVRVQLKLAKRCQIVLKLEELTQESKANLSNPDSKIIRMQNYPSKQQEKLMDDFYHLSDHLDEKDSSPNGRA